MSFNGKVAIITGAGSGIGAEAAKHFSSLGAFVVIVDVNERGLEDVRLACGGNVLSIRADLTQDDDVKRIVLSTVDRFGRVDILLNIAGMLELGGIESTSMEQFDRLHSINIRAVYHLTLLCLPHLIVSKGNIINISSVASKRVGPNRLAYSLTKVAVDHFTKSLAVELGPKGVRVNAINPGCIRTPMIHAPGVEEEELVLITEKMTPLKRMGTTVEIAKAIAFLASDDAGYITGETLSVDGGLRNV